MIKAKEILRNLSSLKNKEKSLVLSRFFKTGIGEYGEGDLFLGISVPVLRKISREYKEIELNELKILLNSKYHEARSLASYILVLKYQKSVKNSSKHEVEELFNFYMKNINCFNNWDLVDLSAPFISGHYFYSFSTKSLKKLLNSKNLWERRVAILSMFYFIRQKDFSLPVKVIEQRLYDEEDLMHKACGWMLREIGKRDTSKLLTFLDKHSHSMPRTALRYSIEKLSVKQKEHYMKQKKLYENR